VLDPDCNPNDDELQRDPSIANPSGRMTFVEEDDVLNEPKTYGLRPRKNIVKYENE
jgi:hypothetical protein